MASASISEIKSFFLGNVTTDSKKSQETSAGDDFSAVFDKTQDSPTGDEEVVKTVKKEDDNSIQNHANIQKKNTPDKLKEKSQVTEERPVEEVVEEAAAAMVNEVAETFNVSVEEVEQVMESLGLTALDLLSSENLTKIVVALNPETDVFTIMTNEELFADLKSLMNTAKDLLNQMGQSYQMSQEDLAALLESMKEAALQTESILQTTDMEAALAEPLQKTQTATVENAETAVDEVFHKEAEERPVTDNQGKTDLQVNTANSQEMGSVTPNKGNGTESHSDTGNDARNADTANQSFGQNLLNQLTEAVDKAAANNAAYGTRGQDIISQITEYIKVHIKADTTEMELQLHPASLGTIKVQITSSEGLLTATFTTQNEAVKTVLETQMIQLKENFEQQGLKVDAVEVNVAAQGFERSLDQQDRDQGQFTGQRQRGQRRIRLSGMEEAEGEILSEDILPEDKVVADMMIRNGNTVDYTV